MTARPTRSVPALERDSSTVEGKAKPLEDAIGRQVHVYRTQLGMTISNLAHQSGLSAGMLSKIENGQTSPSLNTLQLLAAALNVPVTALFRKFEQEREASFVRAGQG
ncbi:MAG: helix-turn-helix transcriptional regulator, partial [Proteobacteria bacterium]|nr:helix-turn-helix transcriptional regulator [Pseudomonadota bacterium]